MSFRLLQIGAVSLAIMVLLTHLVAGRVGRQMLSCGHGVRQLAEGHFAHVALPLLDDETRDLCASLNQAADRLAEYDGRLRSTERVRTLSIVAAGLAHELRNAATGCRIAIDLHGEACPRRDESLQVARQQLEQMEHNLQRLVQFREAPSAGLDFEATSPFDLEKVARQAVDLLSPMASHAGLPLRWRTQPVAARVAGSDSLMLQACVNLLSNAIEAALSACARDATPAGVTVDVETTQDSAVFRVGDSGSGPAVDTDDIFDPLVSTKPEGLGLGLALARQSVEALGGQVRWYRAHDRTYFEVELPLVPAAAEESTHAPNSCG